MHFLCGYFISDSFKMRLMLAIRHIIAYKYLLSNLPHKAKVISDESSTLASYPF